MGGLGAGHGRPRGVRAPGLLGPLEAVEVELQPPSGHPVEAREEAPEALVEGVDHAEVTPRGPDGAREYPPKETWELLVSLWRLLARMASGRDCQQI